MDATPQYQVIDDFTKQFESGKPLKVWHAGPKPAMKRGVAIVVGIAVLTGSAFFLHQHKNSFSAATTPAFWQSVGSSLKNTVSVQGLQPNRASGLVNDQNAERLYKLSAFSTDGVGEKQIGRHVAKIMNEQKESFLSLVAEAEGFRGKGYADNVGVAIGHGWNVTMQTPTYNNALALAVSLSQDKAQALLAFSRGKTNSETLKPQQAVQIAELMGEQFKIGFVEAFARNAGQNPLAKEWQKNNQKTSREFASQVFEKLPENQKAALVYHTYKVGPAGAAKYSALFNALIEQELGKGDKADLTKKTAEHFTYKYKLGSEVKEDVRASVLISAMYLNPEVFEYTIGQKTKVSNIEAKVPAFSRYHIPAAAAGNVIIPDPVGQWKEQQISQGKPAVVQFVGSNDAPTKRLGSMSWSRG